MHDDQIIITRVNGIKVHYLSHVYTLKQRAMKTESNGNREPWEQITFNCHDWFFKQPVRLIDMKSINISTKKEEKKRQKKIYIIYIYFFVQILFEL